MEEQHMFQKKQEIYSETQGVCIVDNIVQLSATKGSKSIEYYVLKPIEDESKVAYIPVKDHKVLLRELFTVEEARELAGKEETKKNPILKAAVEYVLKKEGEQEE